MLGTYPDLGCRTFDIKHLGHTQCTRCEKFCDQVKKIWGAFSEKENQLRFPKPCIVVRKTDVLVCKWMIDLNVFKGIKPDWAEVN